MAYVTREARQELLDTVAEAIAEIDVAIAALGAAYDQLDDHSADVLEDRLFRPLQLAYGRAKATHDGFATRYGLTGRTFGAASPGAPSRGVRAFLDTAVAAVEEADTILSVLQDSMMPVEVGDAELRAGLADVRDRLGEIPGRVHELLRGLGR